MITLYKYRYTLGNEAIREPLSDGSLGYVVFHNGERHVIANREVEFCNMGKLTRDEFYLITKGTEGIIDVKGEFNMAMGNLNIYTGRHSDIYVVNTSDLKMRHLEDFSIYVVMADADGVAVDFLGRQLEVKAGDVLFVKDGNIITPNNMSEYTIWYKSRRNTNSESYGCDACAVSSPESMGS